MVRFSRRTFIVAPVAMAAAPFLAPARQLDPNTILQNLPGLETAYGRRYNPVDGAIVEDWPVDANEATPNYCLVMALTFVSEDAANTVIQDMLSPMTAGIILGRSAGTLEQSSVDSLPEGNVLFAGEDPEEHQLYASLLMVPMAERIWLVQVDGESAAIQATANAIAGYIADAEPVDSDVTVEIEGFAQGGPFDSMPDVDEAELLNGLYPFFDYDLLVSDSPILPDTATAVASPESSPAATPQSGKTVRVEMTQKAQFDPAHLDISVGTTVEWVNVSDMAHTATCDPEQNDFKKTRPELIELPDDAEPWGSDMMRPGDTFRHTFTTPGDYKYICKPHVLSGMEGTIHVEE